MTLDEAIEFSKPSPHGDVATYKWLVELKEARLEIERQRSQLKICIEALNKMKSGLEISGDTETIFYNMIIEALKQIGAVDV